MYAMTALPQHRVTVDEYLAWTEHQEGRFELYAGTVYAMSPERARHAEIKYNLQTALLAGIRRAGLPCYMLPDGMTVRIDETTAYEPDALVYRGQKLPPGAIEVPKPIVVAEILSPATKNIDGSLKLAGYFRVPSVMHYLIVEPDLSLIIRHQRGENDTILTHIVRDGTIRLDPPGLDFTLDEVYGAT